MSWLEVCVYPENGKLTQSLCVCSVCSESEDVSAQWTFINLERTGFFFPWFSYFSNEFECKTEKKDFFFFLNWCSEHKLF